MVDCAWPGYPEAKPDWNNVGFKNWLAQFNALYDPKDFDPEPDFKAGEVQDITRYPTWEQGVSAVHQYNMAKGLDAVPKQTVQALAEFRFKEILRNAGIAQGECAAYGGVLDKLWEAAIENGYTIPGSTVVRW